MTVHQHALAVRVFAQYLRDLAALLDPGRGWYAVFGTRDPEGMRACFEGAEVPPWDVVESLLQDLAAVRGTAFAAEESVQAAALWAASVTAHDGRPGGREALAGRLGVMLREQAGAAWRLRETGAGAADGDADAVAWARDDHARASARCAELRNRLAAVERAASEGRFGAQGAERPEAGGEPTIAPPHLPSGPSASGVDPGAGKKTGTKRRRSRGARFAGLDIEDELEANPVPAGTTEPQAPAPEAARPRGARFGGAPAGDGAGRAGPRPAPPDLAARRAAEDAVALLVRLRADGRSGEAHVVLCEAAGRPAAHLPVLADALDGAGLAADRATLLWEVSSLPPAELAAAAGALAAAGRTEDCGHLLRQGVARPAEEIADAVVALDRAGLEPEARALLGAFVRARTPQDAARVAEGGPHHLVPQLLAAAREVSAAREWDLVHALRVAGIPAP
ncbi:hypothetical protein OG206_05810 [Streptomyces sp. NBC_01341]|uniref:hypothetical protein n=1 Tax=Streptomyces sp. NBC_01341 TaxID=2903831 RepID=UPI002E15919B|nr:hypothetical protein OG206_05810 [Streptomyces sp. NBC_01341]